MPIVRHRRGHDLPYRPAHKHVPVQMPREDVRHAIAPQEVQIPNADRRGQADIAARLIHRFYEHRMVLEHHDVPGMFQMSPVQFLPEPHPLLFAPRPGHHPAGEPGWC